MEHETGLISMALLVLELKYLRIVAQAKQVTRVRGAGVVEQILEVSTAGRGVDPLLQRAIRKIAVVVDSGGPAAQSESAPRLSGKLGCSYGYLPRHDQ